LEPLLFGLAIQSSGQSASVPGTEWKQLALPEQAGAESGGYGYLWWTGDSASGSPQETRFPKAVSGRRAIFGNMLWLCLPSIELL